MIIDLRLLRLLYDWLVSATDRCDLLPLQLRGLRVVLLVARLPNCIAATRLPCRQLRHGLRATCELRCLLAACMIIACHLLCRCELLRALKV